MTFFIIPAGGGNAALATPSFETDSTLPLRFPRTIVNGDTAAPAGNHDMYAPLHVDAGGVLDLSGGSLSLQPMAVRNADAYDGSWSAQVDLEDALAGITVAVGRNAVYREIALTADEVLAWNAATRGTGAHEMRLTDTSNTTIASSSVPGAPAWAEHALTATPTTTATYRLVLLCDDAGADPVLTDAWSQDWSLEALGFCVSDAARGLQAPPAEHISTVYAIIPGARYERTRYGDRYIVLSGVVDVADEAAYRAARRTLFARLNPHSTTPPVTMRYQYGDTAADYLSIAVVYESGLEDYDWRGGVASPFELVFVALDPFWEEV